MLNLALEKFAQQERLFCEPFSILVIREEVYQFVAEDGNTARLQSDYRYTGLNLGAQGISMARSAPKAP